MVESGWWWVFPGFLVLGAWLGWRTWRVARRRWVGYREAAALVALRIAGLVAVGLFLLNPRCAEVLPDPAGYQVAVLVDHSGSMAALDGGSESRSERILPELAAGVPGNWRDRWERVHRLRFFHFGEEVSPGLPVGVPTGRTALGDVLTQGPAALGLTEAPAAWVVISDGRVTAGQGIIDALRPPLGGRSGGASTATEAATGGASESASLNPAALAGRAAGLGGVPVTFLAVGGPSVPPLLELRWREGPRQFASDEPVALSAEVQWRGVASRSGGGPPSVSLTLAVDGQRVESKTVELGEPGAFTVPWEVLGVAPGPHLITVTMAEVPELPSGLPEGLLPLEAATLIEVRDPEVFRIAWLADEVGADFRMLKLAVEDRRDLELRAALALGQGRLWTEGWPEATEATDLAGFLAQAATWEPSHVVIMPTATLARLPEGTREALRSWVDRRGRGLLLLGQSLPPAGLEGLFPARAVVPVAGSPGQALTLQAEPLFNSTDHRALWEGGGLRLPSSLAAGASGLASTGGSAGLAAWARPSLGARAVLPFPTAGRAGGGGDRREESALLWVQPYGAGRVALMSLAHSGEWRLGSTLGARQHAAFWGGLLEWLAVGGRERFAVQPEASQHPTGRPISLQAEVLDADFLPTAAARVTAQFSTLAGADAGRAELLPDLARPGRFTGAWAGREPGVRIVEWRAELPSGEVLRATRTLQITPDTEELADTSADLTAMRDAARLSGGRFARWGENFDPRDLPLAPNVPTVTQEHRWTRNLAWLLLTATLLATEWAWRRRLGFR